MKTHWKGMLSFGLVNIPVALYSATREKKVSFKQLSRSDFSRIRYKKVNVDGTEVSQNEIVKGYEITPDNYVVIEEGELEAISPKASRIIEIVEFVNGEEIDARFYDASYYLAPETGMSKAYALLLEAMQQSDVVGIAKFVLRSREYLAAIRPVGKALMLSTMLFADEIINTEELDSILPQQTEIGEKELRMAKQLIQSLIVHFEPTKYENQYYKQVMELIERKAGQKQIVTEPEGSNSHVLNLMAALEASMAKINQSKKSSKAKRNSGKTAEKNPESA